MKKPQNITRRSFMKGTGLVGATLGITSSTIFGKSSENSRENKTNQVCEYNKDWDEAIKTNSLKREISGLMDDVNMYVRYYQEKPIPSIQLIDSKQIIGANIPIKKLYEIKRRLIEHVNKYDPLNEGPGSLRVYGDLDLV